MSKDKEIDWKTPADILNNASDDEIADAMEKLNPFPGMTAGEAVAESLRRFQEMGLIPINNVEDE